jgi:hypothetical protein
LTCVPKYRKLEGRKRTKNKENMKSRIYFVAALAILSLLLYMFFVGRDAGRSVPEVIRTSLSEDIVKISLAGADGNLVMLEKSSSDEWLLNDSLLADAIAVNSLLNRLRRAEVRMPVPGEGRQEAIKKLSDEGVRMELYGSRHLIKLPGDAGLFRRTKRIGRFTLADAPDVNIGYILTGSSDRPWLIVLPGIERGISGLLGADPLAWRSPVVLNIAPERMKKIEACLPGHPEQSFDLSFDNRGFQFIDGEGRKINSADISSLRLGRFLSTFRELYYEKLLPGSSNEPPDDLMKERMFFSLQVTDTEGNETELMFFRRKPADDGSLVSDKRDYDPNRFYLKTEHGDYAVALYYIFQPVMRPLSYFLQNAGRQEKNAE